MNASPFSSYPSGAVVSAGLSVGLRRGPQKGTGQIQDGQTQKGTGSFSGEAPSPLVQRKGQQERTGQVALPARLSASPGLAPSTSWRHSFRVYAVPALLALAAHAALALSGEKQPSRVIRATPVAETAFTVELKSEPDDEEIVSEDSGSAASEAASTSAPFAPPRLVDVPSFSFSDVFVQPAQLASVPLQTPGLYHIPAAPALSSGNGTGLGQIFALAAVEREPELIGRVPPFFPKDLQRAGVQGEVLLRFVVTRSGDVREVEVVSSTHPGFEQAAIQALRKWRFKPGTVQGQPVATRMEQPIGFTLGK